ncbi:DEP domain-containing protein 1A isoform 2-T2 [Clarias gariepinus]|uniref:DEP domain-containing protein 1A isoform X2 n=1 Tax=Clarias gariepinus TaxID=13013 RepID=UPI00234C52E9|nr:DEP domain-containing protein 1A isoform X2 [Clarias gariepinus]
MDTHIITPGPYRATKLWNEVTKLFRAGMPVKKHRQHLKAYANCFTASTAVDWLHQLLRNNCNFGPEVTRQQTVQLLKKFLKNHVIEDVKGRWGIEDLEDNNQLYRFPPTSPLKPIPAGSQGTRKKSLSLKDRESFFKLRGSKKFDKEIQENIAPAVEESSNKLSSEEAVDCREITEEEIQDIWKSVTLTHLQKLLGLHSLEDVLNPTEVNSHFIVYNMTKVNKHGVVTLEDKTEDLPHWVLSAMKCLANWPKFDQPSYPGFERDVFKSVSDYFHSLPQPMLTFQYYELFVNVLGLLQPSLERLAIETLQLCTLLLPPVSRRKLQLLLRMISRMSQSVDMPRLHDTIGTRTLMVQTFSRCVLSCEEEVDLDELLATRLLSFLMDHHQEILQVPMYLRNAVEQHIAFLRSQKRHPLSTYSFCKQISSEEFEEQKLSLSQAAVAELLESIIKDKGMSVKEKKKKLRLFQKEYPDIYSRRFPTTESEAQLFADKPKIKPPMLIGIRKSKAFSIRN